MFFSVRGSALFDLFFLLIIINWQKMATFKLGAIITEIAGSIGGTTLKRNGSYKVIMNKSSGTPYSRSYNNPSLQYLPFIIKSWSRLEAVEKAKWKEQALLYTFPDKFGTLRTLSGRQLFVKLNAQRWLGNPSFVDVDTISSFTEVFTLGHVIYEPLAPFFNISVEGNYRGFQKYYVSLEISLQPLRAPSFISRKIIGVYELEAGAGTNILEDILKAYPFFNKNYNARLYICAVNNSGFKSVQQCKEMFLNSRE